MNRYHFFTLFLIWWFAACQVHAGGRPLSVDAALEQFNREGDFSALQHHVIDNHTFFGLASYYNTVSFYKGGRDDLQLIEAGQSVRLLEGEWFAAVGRFEVMLLDTPGITLEIEDQSFTVTGTAPLNLNARLVRKDRLHEFGPELDQLRYQQLWWPFAQLARVVEWSLVELKAGSGLNWGMTIVLFSLLLKLLLVPLSIMSVRMQRQVSLHQSQLAPVLAKIKAKYDGEQAHIRIMAAHKELGISTFFVLKPMLLMFVQVPIWIAVFNALGEMPQLAGSSFLWITDLAYPDAIASLPATIPLFGNSVNLLPFLMTLVTLVSARLAEDRYAPATELSRQKRNLYLMALAFFVLFYPFPAAMVLYWTLSNVFHIVQQRWIKV